MSIEVKVGQVWRDKDKRRNTVIEILSVPNDMRGDAEVIGLVVGTEDERSYRIDRLQKRWEMVEEKDVELEAVLTKNTAKHETREQWLRAAVDMLREDIFGDKYPVPEVRVSVGWPGGRGPKQNTIGQCWQPEHSADGVGQIFISPVLSDPVKVLATLVHELVHAINHVNGESGHRGPFKRIAEDLGLEGKMTATEAGPELEEKLEEVAEELGTYPHAAINLESKPKVQKTYMVRLQPVHCDECDPGYLVRTTQKWLDEGMPRCPHGIEMEET